MRLLKWLFQPAYLLLIIVLMALYVNREAVFPEEVAASLEAEALVTRVEGLIERLRPQADSYTETEGDETALTESSPVAIGKAMQEADELIGEDPVDVVSATEVTEELVAEPVQETLLTNSDQLADSISATDSELPVGDEADISAVEPSAPVSDTGAVEASAPVSALDTWRAARTAVWQGDLGGAILQYQALIAAQPDNYDAYGEMGNVLLAQSNVTAAVEAYVSAARLIQKSGNREMAYRLVNVISKLDAEQARALYDEFARQ